MDTEQVSGLSKVSFGSGQGPTDEAALNGLPSIIIENSLLQHFIHQAVELIPHASLSFLSSVLVGVAIGQMSMSRRTLDERPAGQHAECLEVLLSCLAHDIGR